MRSILEIIKEKITNQEKTPDCLLIDGIVFPYKRILCPVPIEI